MGQKTTSADPESTKGRMPAHALPSQASVNVHPNNLKPKLSCDSPLKSRVIKKKKMSVPRRIIRLLASSRNCKRLDFQKSSRKEKQQLCIEAGQSLAKSASLYHSCVQGSQTHNPNKLKKIGGEKRHLDEQKADETLNGVLHSSGSSSDNGNLELKDQSKRSKSNAIVREITKEVIAIDCEMVGIGPKGRISALARCSIIDYEGRTIYDQYVKPDQPITDYRTKWSGIRESHMKDAMSFAEARNQVLNIIRDKIVVGHAIFNDFEALHMVHPAEATRDTSKCHLLTGLLNRVVQAGQHPGLKTLAKRLLGLEIQRKEHCSVEDAQATMRLYRLVEGQWEEEIQSSFPDQQFRTSFLDDHFWPDDLF